MSQALKCNRCGQFAEVTGAKNDPAKDFEQLDYYAKSIGHYCTIHLCQSCHDDFSKKFMKGLATGAKE